ncbi:MAG: zinc transporter ZupT [Phycisphaerae bacterium]|nr:zinc transporter ZupT [Phycisphaerae bacterium]NIP54306.1 zinc transporter ZupT [Phycisphaerae bacterium]NIS53175.1 zinc transporter ZupT [Phycisphaerae bacterium]NIU10660.1 zinc transporter ZupT [Phycisphaerae bacterium]NIU58421.1 zinc transporter ZupT [Phycisphaerae bacterium]
MLEVNVDVSANVGIALALTAIAGLSTGIGSAIAYFIRKPKIVYLSFSLGVSAGVMIYISFMELLPEASETVGEYWGLAAFFIGIGIIALIDMLIPEPENPHEFAGIDEPAIIHKEKSHLMRTGLLMALAIGLHNFPEGLATFASALGNLKLGVFIAIAIAIHNIPEGIAVSVPIFYATGNKNKAFFYSFLSGVSEPVGAIVGYLILRPFLTPVFLAGLMAFVAGIMVYISLDELLPMAHRYGHGHLVIAGIVTGMFIMAVSLLLLH